MKVDFDQTILNLQDEPIKTKKEGKEDSDALTLRDVCCDAMLLESRDQGDRPEGKEKVRRFLLAKRIVKAKGSIDILAEDVVLLKSQIAKLYGPLIVGRAWELLEPTPKADPDPEAEKAKA